MARKATALIIIDMQEDFLKLVSGRKKVVGNCARLLSAARKARIPVFHVRRGYRKDGLDVELPRLAAFQSKGWRAVHGSRGAAAPVELAEEEGEIVLRKPRWSAFFQTELDLLLRRLGVERLYVAGIQTPNCVRTTVYDAIALDYEVVLVEDATSSSADDIQSINVGDMESVGAKRATTASAVKQILA